MDHECYYCDQVFMTKEKLVEHLETAHVTTKDKMKK